MATDFQKKSVSTNGLFMTAIVIAEKPSQARATSLPPSGNSYGVVLAAQGHLLALEEPDAIKPEAIRN